VYSTAFGRRKSWLVPTQLLTGAIMMAMSCCVSSLLGDDGSEPAVRTLTTLFFILYFMMATQDIAVDGWALTILSKENVGYASTCNTVGQTLGYFLSYAGFLALNDPKTCNAYLRSAADASTEPMVTLAGFLGFFGAIFIVVTVLVWAFKTEKVSDEEELSVRDTYKQLWSVLQLPAVQSLCIVLLTCKMGSASADSISGLKIVEYGLPKESLALMSTVLIPVGILLPMVISKYTSGPDPLGIFMMGVWPRIAVGVVYMYVVYATGQAVKTNNGEVPMWLYLIIGAAAMLHQVAMNLMFVAQMSFFNRVSDERIGGTYMTLLNTIANLGSKWSSSLAMFLVDPLTTKGCTKLIMGNTCEDPAQVESCKGAGGTCETTTDGYYTLSAICTVVGIAWFFLMQGRVSKLRSLTLDKWQVRD